MSTPTARRRRLAGIPRRLALVAVLLVCMTAGAGTQAQPDIAVIVNPSVAVDNLSIAELRRILLGDREFWSAGARVTLLIRAPIARERDAVVRDVCQMTEAQFRQHWIGKVFRADTPSGPKIVYSAEMALDHVSRTPGAITFVQTPVTNRSVKVLRIDGRSPGQQGYRLR
jgi:ABC-type phosphate transport system substrate-binding protein